MLLNQKILLVFLMKDFMKNRALLLFAGFIPVFVMAQAPSNSQLTETREKALLESEYPPAYPSSSLTPFQVSGTSFNPNQYTDQSGNSDPGPPSTYGDPKQYRIVIKPE